MELFLEPREEGEEGGVWNTTPPDTDLISMRTWQGNKIVVSSALDPCPDWIRIQWSLWIRIRIRNPNPDPGGQK
jgi:hypothetical protein